MPCLVLTPRLTTDSLRLERAANEAGWSCFRARRYALPPPDVEDPVVYGEIVFCDVMAQELGLGLLEPSNDWLPRLPSVYLQRGVQLIPHGNLKYAVDRRFIKPANDKVFEAGIFEQGRHVPHRYIDPRAPVLVSDVVFFTIEVRCFVLDRRVMTAGVYAFTDEDRSERRERELYEAALEWMGGFLADTTVELPSAVVVDVGLIPDSGWVVVEANQAYASGLYIGGFTNFTATPGCDPREVLPVLERAAGLRSKVLPEDERWLRPLEAF